MSERKVVRIWRPAEDSDRSRGPPRNGATGFQEVPEEKQGVRRHLGKQPALGRPQRRSPGEQSGLI